MRLLVLLAAFGACVDSTDPKWQLAHDRIVAIRTTPAAVGPGQAAQIDALVASVSAAPAVMMPTTVTVVESAPSLAGAVQMTSSGWTITSPDDPSQLRAELGLADTDPLTVDIVATFQVDGVELGGTKSVRLDGEHANPAIGEVTIDGSPIADGLFITKLDAHALAVDEPLEFGVHWLTSCGSLDSDDNEHAATLTVETGDATSGTLAVVLRDELFGVGWETWSISSR